MARAIAITSGKGGVGKTNAATNIGVALSRLGRRVCIFDADLGLANVNIITGQTPTHTIEHLLDGSCTIDQIIMEGPSGVHVVPSGSGVEKLAGISPEKVGVLRSALEKLERDHDYLLIDTAAGIGRDVMGFVRSAHEAIVVVSPEPTSMTDAYALVKLLHRQGYEKNISVLVNMTAGEEEGRRIFESFNSASKKFLGRELRLIGNVVRDYALASSVLKQMPVSLLYPESAASVCFGKIALAIDSGFGPNGVGGFSGSFTAMLAAGEKPGLAARAGATDAAPDIEAFKKWLGGAERSEAEAREALTTLEGEFVSRFGKPYFDFRAGLFSMLDFTDASAGSLKEAAMLVESIHERRFGKPIFEIEDVLLKALANFDSPGRMQAMIDLLERGFERRFGRRAMGAKATVEEAVASNELTAAELENIANAVSRQHRERFGAAPKIDGFVTSDEVLPLVARLNRSEESLRGIEKSVGEVKSENDLLRDILSRLVGTPSPSSSES